MSLFDFEKELSLVYVRDAVVFPDVVVELHINTPKMLETIRRLSPGENLFVVTQKNQLTDNPRPEDFYNIGVTGKVLQVDVNSARSTVLLEASERGSIVEFVDTEPIFRVRYRKINITKDLSEQGIALKNVFMSNVRKLINNGKISSLEAVIKLLSITDPDRLINNLMPFVDESIETKQEILEETSMERRIDKVNNIIAKNLRVSEIEQNVEEKTREELAKTQKEVFLREELKTIQKELGDGDSDEFEDLRKKIENSGMPQPVLESALKELAHLRKTPSFSPEISYIRNYLDWLIDMPWQSVNESKINIDEAKKILDQDHFGLKNVKERILEFLAVQSLVRKIKGPILCFVGPPGTGKTSIGQSIAKALGRKFTRISLGGIRDEAEIRGHRRTYVGAMPGRIIQGIHQAKSKNPVFMMDEIDKIGNDFRGDPGSALLEALDPEQNGNFSDHYLEVPFDLSDVIFITTANVLENIPSPLRDRMEVIDFPGYSPEEKLHIAREFILPKVIKSHGLRDSEMMIEEAALMEVINSYTLEAGVRNLERELSKIARKNALNIMQNEEIPRVILKKDLDRLLGSPKVELWIKEIESQVGLTAALAVTEAGGEVLSIETTLIPGGRGNMTLTGHLGDVMKESAQAALSYARSIFAKYNIEPDILSHHDIHIHVPLGAIPKDGPSAGVAISTSIISSLTKIPVDREIGMTGEITLRGRVLRIGGLKEKILAAKRVGLKKVVYPYANQGDFVEISSEYKKDMSFFPVRTMDELLPITLKINNL